MTHLYLVRHADYVYERDGDRYRDLGLSPEGVAQAERLRDRLARTAEIAPDVFIASTERAAQETARVIAPALGVPVTPDESVEEWRSEDGSLDPDEFMARWRAVPDLQKPYYRWVEGCENRVEFSLRIHLALERILREHAGKTILVLTHGAVIQTSFVYFFGFGEASIQRALPEIGKTSITHWYLPEGQSRWILERSNDRQHLL